MVADIDFSTGLTQQSDNQMEIGLTTQQSAAISGEWFVVVHQPYREVKIATNTKSNSYCSIINDTAVV